MRMERCDDHPWKSVGENRFWEIDANLRGVFSANLFKRISNPAVNDWPLVVSATEIEKVRLLCL